MTIAEGLNAVAEAARRAQQESTRLKLSLDALTVLRAAAEGARHGHR